jgi:hypothetical protein
MDFLEFTDDEPVTTLNQEKKQLDAFYSDNIQVDSISADDSIFIDFRKKGDYFSMQEDEDVFSNDSVSDFEGLLSRIDKVPLDIDFFSQH